MAETIFSITPARRNIELHGQGLWQWRVMNHGLLGRLLYCRFNSDITLVIICGRC